MGKRQRAWAKTERIRIKSILGGKCTDCGSQENLEFDCIEPRGHKHHSAEASLRISFYRRQMREGNLAIRCRSCHAKKTYRENGFEPPGEPDNPTTGSEEILNTLLLGSVNTVNNHAALVPDGGINPF